MNGADGSAVGSSPANRVTPVRSASARSTAKGDVPEAVLDRYLVERDRRGRPDRFFRDHRAREPHFRDRGGALVSSHAYPDAVADMLRIAQHRGWTRVRVAGDEAFRREVWVQAQALGLEVAGHRPRERDRQAAGLERAPDPARSAGEKLSRAAVVVRHLIADPLAQARLLVRARDRLRAVLPERDVERARRR